MGLIGKEPLWFMGFCLVVPSRVPCNYLGQNPHGPCGFPHMGPACQHSWDLHGFIVGLFAGEAGIHRAGVEPWRPRQQIALCTMDLGKYLYTEIFINKPSVSSKFFCCMSTWLLNDCIAYCIVLIWQASIFTLSGFPCWSIVTYGSEKQPMCTQMRDYMTH